MAWLGNGFGCSKKDERTCFTITLGRTLLLRLNTSSPHLGGNKWTTPVQASFGPSDFHLILLLKNFLSGKGFDDDDHLKDAVQKWLTSQAAAFYEEGIQKLVPRYDKCLNNGGDYAEK